MHPQQPRCERVLANAGCAWMVLRAVGWGGCARGWSRWWGLTRGLTRGGGACRQSDRRRLGGIVEVQCPSNMHGASLKRSPPRRETFASLLSVSPLAIRHRADDQTLIRRRRPTEIWWPFLASEDRGPVCGCVVCVDVWMCLCTLPVAVGFAGRIEGWVR